VTRRFAPLGAACAVVAILLSGCGIGAEDAPRNIRPELLKTVEAPAVALPGSGQRVWMVAPEVQGRPTQLQAVERAAVSTPAELLELVLGSVTVQERSDRISSAIPQDTQLRSARLGTNRVLIVDLSKELVNASGDLLVDAVAQIVFTAAEFEGVDAVRLLIEGEPREWLRGNGTTSADPLTIFDFPEHNPTTQPDYPAIPSPPASEASTTTAD
jgi:Sporulation and spore germination